jgi:hypothetical protein
LIQEWRRSEPLRQPERQKERFRKQRVKVILVSGLFCYGYKEHLPNQNREPPSPDIDELASHYE